MRKSVSVSVKPVTKKASTSETVKTPQPGVSSQAVTVAIVEPQTRGRRTCLSKPKTVTVVGAPKAASALAPQITESKGNITIPVITTPAPETLLTAHAPPLRELTEPEKREAATLAPAILNVSATAVTVEPVVVKVAAAAQDPGTPIPVTPLLMTALHTTPRPPSSVPITPLPAGGEDIDAELLLLLDPNRQLPTKVVEEKTYEIPLTRRAASASLYVSDLDLPHLFIPIAKIKNTDPINHIGILHSDYKNGLAASLMHELVTYKKNRILNTVY